MNREDILAMKPSRELDAFVAEKVMGYEPGTATLGGWHPSEDLSAAWEVVEGLRDKYYHIEIMTDEEFWKVRTNADEWVFSRNLTEAICKAALLAVMEARETE